jgi:hypothetical protein
MGAKDNGSKIMGQVLHGSWEDEKSIDRPPLSSRLPVTNSNITTLAVPVLVLFQCYDEVDVRGAPSCLFDPFVLEEWCTCCMYGTLWMCWISMLDVSCTSDVGSKVFGSVGHVACSIRCFVHHTAYGWPSESGWTQPESSTATMPPGNHTSPHLLHVWWFCFSFYYELAIWARPN